MKSSNAGGGQLQNAYPWSPSAWPTFQLLPCTYGRRWRQPDVTFGSRDFRFNHSLVLQYHIRRFRYVNAQKADCASDVVVWLY